MSYIKDQNRVKRTLALAFFHSVRAEIGEVKAELRAVPNSVHWVLELVTLEDIFVSEVLPQLKETGEFDVELLSEDQARLDEMARLKRVTYDQSISLKKVRQATEICCDMNSRFQDDLAWGNKPEKSLESKLDKFYDMSITIPGYPHYGGLNVYWGNYLLLAGEEDPYMYEKPTTDSGFRHMKNALNHVRILAFRAGETPRVWVQNLPMGEPQLVEGFNFEMSPETLKIAQSDNRLEIGYWEPKKKVADEGFLR